MFPEYGGGGNVDVVMKKERYVLENNGDMHYKNAFLVYIFETYLTE